MIKKILFAFLLLFVALTIIGLFLPKDYRVERSRNMAFTPAQILALTADLPTWEHWTGWNKEEDPDCVWTFVDATTFTFEGPINGQGKIMVTSATEKGMTWDLAFSEGKYLATGGLEFHPSSDGTEVVWYTEGVIEGAGPLDGWIGLMMDGQIGPYFEVNLEGMESALKSEG